MNVADEQALIAATAVLLDKAAANLAVAQQHLRNIAESLDGGALHLPSAAGRHPRCPTCGEAWTCTVGVLQIRAGMGKCIDMWHVEHFPTSITNSGYHGG